MYYNFDDLYEGLVLESLAQLYKLTSGVVVINNNIVVEKCKSREEVTKQGVIYDFNSRLNEDVYLIWKDIIMANQTYNIPPADIDADFFEDEMIDDYPKCIEDDMNWDELDEVLCKDVISDKKKTIEEHILDCLNLIDRYNEWLFNEFEYPDIDIENESAPNEFLMFFEEEFRNKIRCEKCGSIIDARNWKNLGGYIDEHAIGVRYLKSLGKITNCRKVSCPVCGNIKEIDNKYIVSPEDKA